MNFFKTGLLAIATMGLTACGSQSVDGIIDAVKVRTYEHPSTHHQYVEIKAEIDSANMIFPTADLKVVDPKNPAKELGTVQLLNDLNGKNILVVNADVSGFRLGNYTGDTRLPNGTALPVAGLQKVYALDVKGGKTRLYVGEYQNEVMVGVAVALKEFDGLAASVPNANVFFSFPSDTGVAGIAGFFTGTKTSTSGIAMFAKADLNGAMGLQKTTLASRSDKIQFQTSKIKSKDLFKTQYFFWNLNRRGGKLQLAH